MPSARRPLGLLQHGLLILPGALAGGLGSFVHAVRIAGLPVGLSCALALSAAVFVTGGLLTATRSGPAAAAAGWLGPVLLLSAPRAEGDLVVSGDLLGYAWLLGGMLLAGLALAVPWQAVAGPSASPGDGR